MFRRFEQVCERERQAQAQAGENDRDIGQPSSAAESVDFSKFPTFYLPFYWVLFGQLVLLLLSLFGYESLRPVIDWVASIIPSVESLRHSEVVMNKELARAHYALMWLCSPALIIAALFSPVRPGEVNPIFEGRVRSNALFFWLSIPVLIIVCFFLIYGDIFESSHSIGFLARFAIGFALLSSFYSSIIACILWFIKLSLTD